MKKSKAETKDTTAKTTVRLPKELLTAARIHVLEKGVTLQSLMKKLLEEHLRAHKGDKR